MTKLMKQIRQVMKDNPFAITIYEDSVLVELYEVEVPIVYSEGVVELQCETYDWGITKDMMGEIFEVMGYMEDNSKELDELLMVGDK